MRSLSSFRSAVVVAALLSTLAANASAQTVTPLFEPGPAVGAVAPARRGGMRTRTVRPRLDILAAAFADRRAPLTLNLFDDVVLELTRLRVDDATTAFRSWIGTSSTDDAVVATLTVGAAGLSGSAMANGVPYALEPTSDGAVVVRELTRVPAGPELPARLPDEVYGIAAAAGTAPDIGHSSIDVLVLYTAAARVQQGGDAPVRAALANAMAVTNAAFQRSGVSASLLTADLREVTFGESASGITDDLTALSPGGAHFAAVESLRLSAGADLVALVVGRVSAAAGCGVAYLGPSPAAIYSVTEAACLSPGQWSFTHELGHNFGADHAPGDPIVSPVVYARGFRDAAVRTLMAYPAAGAPARSLNYSSRVVREPAGTGVPTGNDLQDNARLLQETAAAVAAFTASRFLPDAPVGIETSVVADTVVVRWAAAQSGGPVTSYRLWAGIAPGATTFGPFATTERVAVFTGVRPGRYYVRLRSLGPGGISADSAEAIVDVVCLVPGPGTVVASAAGGAVTLRWSAAAGVGPTRYEVGVGTTPAATEIGVVAVGTLQEATVPAPPGVYYVRVRGVNDCGPGGVSPAVRVVVP